VIKSETAKICGTKGLKERKRKKEGRKVSPNTKFLTVFYKLDDYVGINK
jgi:hypothetical protein